MTPEMEKHLKADLHLSKKVILWNNFLGGLAWGFGSVVGATVVVTIVGAILNHFGVFNGIKLFFDQLQALP